MNKSPLNYSMDLDITSARRSLTYDFWILLSVFCLSTFGIAMIYSASQSYDMALRQCIYFVLGFSSLLLISFSNFRKMESIYLFCYWPGLILLLLVLFLLIAITILIVGLIWEFLLFNHQRLCDF